MLLGYARVSTDDQDLALQRRALREAGCRRLYEEKLSGAQRNRPELARLLDQVRDGDVLVVTRLDRLARSTRDLLDMAERLRSAGAGLRSLAEPWADTTSPAGRMVLTVFAGTAGFKRALILGRPSAGRAAAQQKGVRFDRPRCWRPIRRHSAAGWSRKARRCAKSPGCSRCIAPPCTVNSPGPQAVLVSTRAQWCPAPHASMTTVQVACFSKNATSSRPWPGHGRAR